MFKLPKIKITTEDSKLKLKATHFVSELECPITYNNIIYATGKDDENRLVDFNILIPYYIMKCEIFPLFYYNLTNKYTKRFIPENNLQYYLEYSLNNKKKVIIKFQKSLPNEICKFQIKDALTKDSVYQSKCGNTDKESCYALCKDIELELTSELQIVNVNIQSRHFNTDNNPLSESNQYSI